MTPLRLIPLSLPCQRSLPGLSGGSIVVLFEAGGRIRLSVRRKHGMQSGGNNRRGREMELTLTMHGAKILLWFFLSSFNENLHTKDLL